MIIKNISCFSKNYQKYQTQITVLSINHLNGKLLVICLFATVSWLFFNIWVGHFCGHPYVIMF